MLTTIDDVIERLGGTTRVADRLGVSPSAVSNWRSRQSFPADRYMQIRAAVGRAGVSRDLFAWADEEEGK